MLDYELHVLDELGMLRTPPPALVSGAHEVDGEEVA